MTGVRVFPVNTPRDLDAVAAATKSMLAELLRGCGDGCPGLWLAAHQTRVCEHDDEWPTTKGGG